MAFILLSACSKKKTNKKPDDLIPRAQMENILYDIYLADAYANNVDYTSPHRDYFTLLKYREAENLIFKKYKISSKRFHSSMEYYVYYDDDLPSLYDNLYARFDAKKKEVMKDSIAFRKKDSILHPEKRIRAKHIQDSINKAINKAAQEFRRKDSLNRIKALKKSKLKKALKPISFSIISYPYSYSA